MYSPSSSSLCQIFSACHLELSVTAYLPLSLLDPSVVNSYCCDLGKFLSARRSDILCLRAENVSIGIGIAVVVVVVVMHG